MILQAWIAELLWAAGFHAASVLGIQTHSVAVMQHVVRIMA
jgi:hypothetical protein